MISIYGTHVQQNLPVFFFSFSQYFDFPGHQGDKRAKNGPKWQKVLSIMPYISGNIYIIFIYGTDV